MKTTGRIPKEIAVQLCRGKRQVRFDFLDLDTHGYIRDSGRVNVYGPSREVNLNLINWFDQNLDQEIEVGATFKGLVLSISDFSATVQIGFMRLAGHLHIANQKTKQSPGNFVWVKVYEFRGGLLFLEEDVNGPQG